MQVYTKEIDHIGYVRLSMYFKAGKMFEPISKPGIAYFCQQMFFRKYGKYCMQSLYETVNKMGVNLKGSTGENFVSFEMNVRSEYLSEAIDLVLGAAESYDWNEEDFLKTREVVLKQIEDDYDSYFDNQVRKKYYSGLPRQTRIKGSYETVEVITLEDVNEYKRERFNKDNACLVITGDIPNHCKAKIRELSDPIASEKSGYHLPKNFLNRDEDDDLIMPGGNGYCAVTMSFDMPRETDDWILEFILDILAIGDGSILSWIFKEENGWVGDIFCEYDRCKDFYRSELYYDIYSENLISSLTAAFNEIKKLYDGVPEEYMDIVRPFHTNRSYPQMNIEAYNDNVAYRGFLKGQEYDNDILCEKASKITGDEISDYIRRYFNGETLSVSVKYDNKEVKRKDIKNIIREFRRNSVNK